MKNTLLLTVLLIAGTYCPSFAGKYAEVVKGFYAAIDAGDFDKAASYLSSDVMATLPLSPVPLDLAGYRALGMSMKAGFPDMQHRIVEITEGKGSCAFKAIFTGTNTAALQGNPPTRNQVESAFLGIFKFNKSGKVIQVELQFDVASFNAQLMKGIPPPQNKATELVNIFFNTVIGKKHNTSVLNDLLATDFIGEFPVPHSSRDQFIGGIKEMLGAFPDMQVTVTEQYFEGNKVFSHGYIEATNSGSFMGMPPTGKRVHVAFMDVWTEAGGKLIKNDVVMDMAGMMAQLGDPAVALREKNTASVKNIYEAFGKGDIPTVLSYLSENVVWTDAGTSVGNLHTGVRRGKAAVMSFFDELNKTIAFEDFKVNEYIANGNTVVANGHYKGKVKASGKHVSTDFSMTWEFDQSGKVVRHHLYLDTDNVAKAIAGLNNNLATVRTDYENFLTGNISGILETMSENVVWIYPGDPAKIPFAGTFKGKAGVMKFFENVGKNVQTVRFEPNHFREAPNKVMNAINITGKVLQNGKMYDNVLDVTWTFDSAGKVIRWEGKGDVRNLEAAFAK